jgi:hypothetical protein
MVSGILAALGDYWGEALSFAPFFPSIAVGSLRNLLGLVDSGFLYRLGAIHIVGARLALGCESCFGGGEGSVGCAAIGGGLVAGSDAVRRSGERVQQRSWTGQDVGRRRWRAKSRGSATREEEAGDRVDNQDQSGVGLRLWPRFLQLLAMAMA